MSVGRKVLDKQMVKRKQIFDVQTWDRGFAGAVMCETRGPGIQWPQWHTLLFEGAGGGGDESGCLQDVKKMLLKQTRMVCWKRGAAKHGCEGLREEVWLEPIQVTICRERSTKGGQTSTDMWREN